MTLHRAYFQNLDTDETISVQFNPTDLSFNKTAQFAEIAIPGLDAPVLQFIRGSTETLSVELFFDTTDNGMDADAHSVTEWTDGFYRLVKQNPETHAPPRCRFSWGESAGAGPDAEVSNAPFWFTCVVESVERKFLLFSPADVPLRAPDGEAARI